MQQCGTSRLSGEWQGSVVVIGLGTLTVSGQAIKPGQVPHLGAGKACWALYRVTPPPPPPSAPSSGDGGGVKQSRSVRGPN